MQPLSAVTLGRLHEVGVYKVGRNHPSAVLFKLSALYVPVRGVVEDQRHCRNLMLHGCRQLGFAKVLTGGKRVTEGELAKGYFIAPPCLKLTIK